MPVRFASGAVSGLDQALLFKLKHLGDGVVIFKADWEGNPTGWGGGGICHLVQSHLEGLIQYCGPISPVPTRGVSGLAFDASVRSLLQPRWRGQSASPALRQLG
jgi:hypothetical protein